MQGSNVTIDAKALANLIYVQCGKKRLPISEEGYLQTLAAIFCAKHPSDDAESFAMKMYIASVNGTLKGSHVGAAVKALVRLQKQPPDSPNSGPRALNAQSPKSAEEWSPVLEIGVQDLIENNDTPASLMATDSNDAKYAASLREGASVVALGSLPTEPEPEPEPQPEPQPEPGLDQFCLKILDAKQIVEAGNAPVDALPEMLMHVTQLRNLLKGHIGRDKKNTSQCPKKLHASWGLSKGESKIDELVNKQTLLFESFIRKYPIFIDTAEACREYYLEARNATLFQDAMKVYNAICFLPFHDKASSVKTIEELVRPSSEINHSVDDYFLETNEMYNEDKARFLEVVEFIRGEATDDAQIIQDRLEPVMTYETSGSKTKRFFIFDEKTCAPNYTNNLVHRVKSFVLFTKVGFENGLESLQLIHSIEERASQEGDTDSEEGSLSQRVKDVLMQKSIEVQDRIEFLHSVFTECGLDPEKIETYTPIVLDVFLFFQKPDHTNSDQEELTRILDTISREPSLSLLVACLKDMFKLKIKGD